MLKHTAPSIKEGGRNPRPSATLHRSRNDRLISPLHKHDHYIRPRCGFGLKINANSFTNPEYRERNEPSYVTEMSSHYRQMILLNVTIGFAALQHREFFYRRANSVRKSQNIYQGGRAWRASILVQPFSSSQH